VWLLSSGGIVVSFFGFFPSFAIFVIFFATMRDTFHSLEQLPANLADFP
jgi:hypothetical protein